MKCVVLLGFSTTGKSSILRNFRETQGSALETIDSDEWLARNDGGHVYNVYLRFRDGQNTGPSIQAIEGRERDFLRGAGPQEKPLLLAAGPFLPLREPEWSQFCVRVGPVFLYLQKDPEDVLDGLLQRRARQLQDRALANTPGFGCWDEGVTTEYRDGVWLELPRAAALQNVRNNMAGMVARYARLASQTFTWRDRETVEGQTRLLDAIRLELGL